MKTTVTKMNIIMRIAIKTIIIKTIIIRTIMIRTLTNITIVAIIRERKFWTISDLNEFSSN